MDFSVGVGLTNACDLACAHCYRDVDRVDQLTEAQVLGVCDDLPVRSVNLGTGENGLHPDYAAIVRALRFGSSRYRSTFRPSGNKTRSGGRATGDASWPASSGRSASALR